MKRGNCYVVSEAIYHVFKKTNVHGWKSMHMNHENESHWFLKHESGMILDLTAGQFKKKPDYSKAKGMGFLTKEPSRKAAKLMETMLWQEK